MRALATLDLVSGALTHRPLPHQQLSQTTAPDTTKEFVREAAGLGSASVFMRVNAKRSNGLGGVINSEAVVTRALGAAQHAPEATLEYSDRILHAVISDPESDAVASATQWWIDDGCKGGLISCPQRSWALKGQSIAYRLPAGRTSLVRAVVHDRTGGSRLIERSVSVPADPVTPPVDPPAPVDPGVPAPPVGPGAPVDPAPTRPSLALAVRVKARPASTRAAV